MPLLQYDNPGISITPIMVTAMPWERMAGAFRTPGGGPGRLYRREQLQLGRDIVFLISADANHYGRDFANIPYGEDEKAHARGTDKGPEHRPRPWSTAGWTIKKLRG